MPRALHNFQIEGRIDGRATPISAGPRSKTGGFSLKIKIRDQGRIARAADIEGIAAEDGTLTVRITPHDGEISIEDGSLFIRTKR